MLGDRKGFLDPRGGIFFECLETIRHCRLRAFVLENVKGIVTHNHGDTLRILLQLLRRLPGYTIYHDVLNTIDYGLPQHRERLYIVGIYGKTKKPFRFPQPQPLKLRAVDLLERNITRRNHPKLFALTDHKHDILKDLLHYKKIDSLKKNWFVNLNVSSYRWTGARRDICPCLLAGHGGGCIYYLTSRNRILTPREYLRLQGFPENFRICVPPRMIYKQAGNSMSVNVLEAIFRRILHLRGDA